MGARNTTSETFARLFERVGRQFVEASRLWGPAMPYGRWVSATEPMAVDLLERGDEFVATADLPGVGHDDIDVRVADRTLRIAADHTEIGEGDAERLLRRERGRGSTHRSIRLPEDVDAERANARLTNGVLTVTLPKPDVEGARTIEIE
ncbi:Hsp20/alpha crystallin family protein [Natronomonas sp.]|uniref:Hsp20/alpha crystallin family protein n=1 Tax=Natronomonas sp. TaxID=2184060 RepID=UPI00397704C4